MSINSSDDTKLWIEFIREVRSYVAKRENGIKGGVYAPPRAIFAGAKDLKHAPAAVTVYMIADSTVFKGLDRDTKVRILNVCPLPVISRNGKPPVAPEETHPETPTTPGEHFPLTGNTWPARHQLRAMGAYWDKPNKRWMVPASKFEEAKSLIA